MEVNTSFPNASEMKTQPGYKGEDKSVPAGHSLNNYVNEMNESRSETRDSLAVDSHDSDLDVSDFESTVSLASSCNSLSTASKHAAAGKNPERVIRLDPQVYRKHRESNMSLRYNLSEKLMKVVILTGIKKMDKLSQNIFNH
jgi:hypothetical protein